MNETQCPDTRRRHVVELGNERVIGDVTDQLDTHLAQLLAPGGLKPVMELNKEQTGGRRLDGPRLKRRGDFGRR